MTSGASRSEAVTTHVRPQDLERLQQSAERRGVELDDVVAEAIDAFLAREMWSGGYVTPPPMEVPSPYPWKAGAFRLRRKT